MDRFFLEYWIGKFLAKENRSAAEAEFFSKPQCAFDEPRRQAKRCATAEGFPRFSSQWFLSRRTSLQLREYAYFGWLASPENGASKNQHRYPEKTGLQGNTAKHRISLRFSNIDCANELTMLHAINRQFDCIGNASSEIRHRKCTIDNGSHFMETDFIGPYSEAK